MKVAGRIVVTVLLFCCGTNSYAQPAVELLKAVKAKMDQVNDYVATGKMKTDVVFIKAPISNIKSYYKKPNKFKLTRAGGISLLPKGGVSVNISSLLLTDEFTTIDAGEIVYNKQTVKVIKLLPLSEKSDIVLSTLYIDAKNLLIKKSSTTTKENGTFEMELTYGQYGKWGLPDKVVFSFNTKDYKLPKGITFEYDDGSKKPDLPKNKKGRVEIEYSSYVINKGVSDALLK
jgi:outer membrane lipoprotein-sorting protein